MTEPKKESDKSWFGKLKANFRPTEVTESDETLFDICMKCGKRLPDRKLTTLKAHQKIAHPMTNKEKRSTFMYKHMIFLLFSFMTTIVLISVLVPDAFEFPFELIFGVAETTSIDVESCTDKTLILKQRLFVQGEFTSNDAVDLNYLMQECNASFWSYKFGGTIFDAEMYSPDNMNLDELREERVGTKFLGKSLPATKVLGE